MTEPEIRPAPVGRLLAAHRLDRITDPDRLREVADARRDNEIWKADRRRRAAEAPDCRRHRGQPAHNCGVCRSEALGARTGEFRLIPGGTP